MRFKKKKKLCNRDPVNIQKCFKFIKNHDFSYINYSNIAARILRRALKPEARVEAVKRDESHIRFTPWTNGKPIRKFLLNSLFLLLYLLNILLLLSCEYILTDEK